MLDYYAWVFLTIKLHKQGIFLQFTTSYQQWKNGKWGIYKAYKGLTFFPLLFQSNSYCCMIWFKFIFAPWLIRCASPLLWNSDVVNIPLYLYLCCASIVRIIASLLLLSAWSLLILASYRKVTGGHGSFLLLVSHRSTMMMVFGWGWMMKQ